MTLLLLLLGLGLIRNLSCEHSHFKSVILDISLCGAGEPDTEPVTLNGSNTMKCII